jgi:drug/metabolite transporter (DMT)-like permease
VTGSTARPTAAPARAALFMLGAVALFTLMDVFAKAMADHFHTVQIVWARYAFHIAILFVLMPRRLIRVYGRTGNARLQVLRGALILGATSIFFTALGYVPLADAVAVDMLAPLFVVALSIPILGEKVGPRRWVAVVVGFLGAMVVIRPGLGAVHPAAMLIVVSTALFALYQVVTRLLSTADHPLTTLLYTGGTGVAVLSFVVPFVWRDAGLEGWLLMIGIGAVGCASNFLIIKAFELAQASFLAPFVYSQIVTGTLFGLFFFGDFPDAYTLCGAGLIVASGLYIIWRESRADA